MRGAQRGWYRFLAFAAACVLSATVLASMGGRGASGASSAQLSVRTGPADISGTQNWGDWLGRPVDWASDDLDHTKTWADISSPGWLLSSWGPWVGAAPNRRLILGVPLLITSAAGQLQEGANGAFDQYFQTLAQNLVRNHLGSSVLRLGWEANGDWMPWSAVNDPGSYVAYFDRVVTIMRSVPGAAFVIDFNPNAGAWANLATFDPFYPGDAYVDVIGLDVYDVWSGHLTATPQERWQWLLSEPLGLQAQQAFANAHHKPVSFPEWGLYAAGTDRGGGGDDMYYIDQMANWFATNNTLYQSYFDIDYGGGTLATFPNGQAEYKVRFGVSSTTTTAPAATTTTTAPAATTTTSAPPTTTTTAPRTTTTTAPPSKPQKTRRR